MSGEWQPASAGHTKDDFWCSIVPRRHDGRVKLVAEGRRPKVDETDVGVLENVFLFGSRALRAERSGAGDDNGQAALTLSPMVS